ncbi:MAG: PD-(D/E)XK nuclease family protein [Armatimonadetes bacterium]|nr:PD-(D/E)XK nuclease family protein [Armatimonadota bacterium]
MKPPLTVWTAPALGGKTRRCVATCLQEGERVRLVLPSDLQAQMARSILLAEGMSATAAEQVVCSLYAFALQIASAWEEVRIVPNHLRRWLLYRAVQEVAKQSALVARAASREGVLTLLTRWVREMVREGIAPPQLQELALHSPEQEKVAALAQILRHYLQLLAARGWHEEEEVYSLATQAIRAQLSRIALPRWVLIDGFIRFSRRETEFLRALAEAGCQLTVTLCWEEGREGVFASTTATLRWLAQHFEVHHQTVTTEPPGHVSATIAHIAAHLFSSNPSPPVCGQDAPAVEIWEAPHLLAEAEMVAREIVRQHRQGVAWGEMAVLCRDISSVLPVLESVFERFGVPTQSFERKTLGEHPLVRTLAGLLHLHENDYPREGVLQWLKGGYLPVDIFEADRFRSAAVRRGVRAGAANWLKLAERMEREGNPVAPLLRTLVESTQAIAQATEPLQWFAALQATLQATHFGIALHDESEQEVLSDAMEVAHQVLALLAQDEAGTPADWAQAVEQAWKATPQRRGAAPRNAVWLLEAEGCRPLHPRLAFLMGMQEGRFPRRLTEDALLRDADRKWLNAHVGTSLPLSIEDAQVERLVFYQAATCASQRVVFTYSRTEGDHDVPPSYYLRALRELFSPEGVLQHSVRLSEVTVPLAHTLDEQDAERTLVDSLFDVTPHTRRVLSEAEREQAARAIYCWLTERPERCRLWWRWRYIPAFPRLSTALPDGHTRPYSATELEDLQRCPFRHFVRWELRLRPEKAHYATEQGRWLHAVLQRRQNSEQPLHDLIHEVTERYPVDRPTGERYLLQQQLEEMVHSVLHREAQLYAAFGLQVLWTEATFGEASEDEEQALGEVATPLRLTLPDGRRMWIRGRIDRVEYCPQTGATVLVEYKRDLPNGWWQRVQQGEDLQIVLYVAALRQVWKRAPAAVALDSALEGKRYRIVFTDLAPFELLQRLSRLPQEDYSVVQHMQGQRWRIIERRAVERISELLRRRQSGDIRPLPGDHCSLCEYGGLCRTVQGAGTPLHDGEPYPAESGW